MNLGGFSVLFFQNFAPWLQDLAIFDLGFGFYVKNHAYSRLETSGNRNLGPVIWIFSVFWIFRLGSFLAILEIFWSKSTVLGWIGRSGKALGFISADVGPNPTTGSPEKGSN